jgi:hypothetical protein
MPYTTNAASRTIFRLLVQSVIMALAAAGAYGGDEAPRPVQAVTITSRYNVQQGLPKNLRDFLSDNPQVRLKQWSGIALPGGMQASLAMGIADNGGERIGSL